MVSIAKPWQDCPCFLVSIGSYPFSKLCSLVLLMFPELADKDASTQFHPCPCQLHMPATESTAWHIPKHVAPPTPTSPPLTSGGLALTPALYCFGMEHAHQPSFLLPSYTPATLSLLPLGEHGLFPPASGHALLSLPKILPICM